MAWRFRHHYTREEARALLPQIRSWLERLGQLRNELATHETRTAARCVAGEDLGGDNVNAMVRNLARFQETIGEFRIREIQLKDLERGLIDFPAIIGGREVFLCWEQDEDDIEHWHDLDTGFPGREKI